MNRGPEDSARLRPVRAGQRLTGAGQFSSLVTVQPALNLIVAGVSARQVAQGVSLEVDATLSDCMTVWFGYDPAEAANNVQPTFDPVPSWPASAVAQPTRRIFGVVKWGIGGGQQYVEIDVSEGVGVTIPTSVCEAYAYSENTPLTQDGRAVDQAIEPQPWTVHVHAAPGRAAKEARRTRQVVQPYLIAPDELCPQGFNPDWCAFIDKTMDLIAGDGDGDGDGDEPLGYFDAMAKPLVPHPNDVEFDSPADLAAFTTWRVDTSSGTYSAGVANSVLSVSLAGQNVRFAGLTRTTPTGQDFSVWTKMSMGVFDLANGDEGICALILADDNIITNPSTADVLFVCLNQYGINNTGPKLGILRARYNAGAVVSYYNSTPLSQPYPQSVWMRVRWRNAPAKMFFDVSLDGVAWTEIKIGTDVPLTPTRAGFAVYNTFNTNTITRHDFLRFSNSSAFADFTLGRVV